MAGAVETMAVTPQMLVPAAMRVPRRGGRPSRRLNRVTSSNPVAIAASTTGTPAAPSRAISITLSLMPTRTMPSRSTVVVQNLRPTPTAAGTGSRLRISRPSTIATATPETGLAPCRPKAASNSRPSPSASAKPASITAVAAAIPGNRASTRVTPGATPRRPARRRLTWRKGRPGAPRERRLIQVLSNPGLRRSRSSPARRRLRKRRGTTGHRPAR